MRRRKVDAMWYAALFWSVLGTIPIMWIIYVLLCRVNDSLTALHSATGGAL